MPSALIIPGVQVTTVFEPSPALPGPTGILGIVGVADRGPLEPTQVGAAGQFSGDIATLGWTAKSLAGGCAG